MKKAVRLKRRTTWVLLACLLCAAGAFAYSLWEYTSIKVTSLALDSPELSGLTVVFAADFQFDLRSGGGVQEQRFAAAIDAIVSQQPDLILLGGDYITYAANWQAAVPHLARLEAPLGVYAVFGNHDWRCRDALAEALPGITFLRNQAVTVEHENRRIAITGVEDLWHGAPALPQLPDCDYSLLLTHNPDYYEHLSAQERGLFDLTLAGHTHAGQVTFFGLAAFPPAFKVSDFGEKYRYGEKHEPGRIYITSGLGGAVFHMPIRFGARPEIVVIE